MIFKVFVILFVISNVVYSARVHKLKTNKKTKEFSNDTLSVTQSVEDVNITKAVEEQNQQRIVYGKWTKWSSCRNCHKIRRKVCVSPKCNNSILYEKKPCNLSRCKRQNIRRNRNIHIIKKMETREMDVNHLLYKKWSKWSLCSEHCITRRYRNCKKPGTCEQNPDVEVAYCYRDGTACHYWIQNMFHKRQSRNHKQYHYDTSNRGRRKKIKHKKPRKCGIAYRTRNKYHGMLKIMGGQLAKPSKWPWHVALLNYRKEVFCGGTLISPNWVLTAAHCLRKILFVRLNEYDISYDDGSEIEYIIREMHLHPNYNTKTVDNDIALLKLPKSVPLSYACLPENSTLPVNQNCTIVGWGKRSPFDFLGSKYLREAQMPVVSKATCKRSYRRYVITDNMFCAGYKNGGTDSCSGDSGGGFMCLPKGKRYGWTVQGITSFGESCGKKEKYGIYTDVRKYVPWLKKKIKKL